MKDQEIIERIQNIAQSVLGRDDIQLTKRSKFDDFGVNSFGKVQIVCAIEEEFGIEIPNSVIRTFNNVPKALKYIKRQIQAKESE